MHIAYARTPLRKSIFLAGPTPRSPEVPSWRPRAVQLLQEMGFDGTVFVPEDDDASWKFSYDDQIEWELEALHSATVIAFWVPRDLETMPAFTTNVEFGLFAKNRNVVLGCPEDAPKMKYLDGIARLYGLLGPWPNLEGTMAAALNMAERPFRTTI
jgi:hypothetical protein